MAIVWNRHRFSGGLLVLDTTNTVVLRGDAARSFDRFEHIEEIGRFAQAASGFRAAELGGRRLSLDPSADRARRVVELREAADRLFRRAATAGSLEARLMPDVLRASAACLDACEGEFGRQDAPFGDPSSPLPFEAALAVSALSLLSGQDWRKVRICPNCNWLFLDRSRNGSRLWCDMSVCGNRHKARRYYERNKIGEEGSRHA